jgi:GAF domain-containing protein
VIIANWRGAESPPADTEERMARFAELLATAIANADAREALKRLADEQAALRRVATLVARGASPAAVFGAVAEEMVALLDAHGISLCRYEPGDELTVLAHRGPEAGQLPPGTRVRLDGESVSGTVRRTKRPARMETYAESGGHVAQIVQALEFRAGVGVPIIVDGQLWGSHHRELGGRDGFPAGHRGTYGPIHPPPRDRDSERRQP